MAFSYTGFAYLLGFFACVLLSYRFFQYWQRTKSVISKCFFYFAGFFVIFMLITAIAGLFFSENSQVLRLAAILAAFFQTLALSAIGYLLIHLKFPKISPWLGFTVIFLLGLMETTLSIATPFNPYLEPGGGINWNAPLLTNSIRLFIFLITFLPFFFIFIQQARTSEDPFIKAKAFGLGMVFIFATIAGFFDFFLETTFELPATSSDFAAGLLSVFIIMTILFTKKLPSPLKNEKF